MCKLNTAVPEKVRHTVDSKINVGTLLIAMLIAGLLIMSGISLTCGRYPISISDLLTAIIQALSGKDVIDGSPYHLIIFNVRLPRMLAAMVVGAALGGSGACYQAIFRNPMVEPSLLGVTAGSAFGAAIAILFSLSIVMIQINSFLFGILAVFLTSILSRFVSKSGDRTLTLVLCGIITGTLFSAFLSLTKYVADPYSKLPAITYWLMGSLASINMKDIHYSSLICITGLIPLMLLRWQINTMSFGEEEAKTLGINTTLMRTIVICSSTLMTASAVSISGMIGWVGLVIPHLARMVAGPSFTILFPLSMLMGSFFLLMVDTISRVSFPVEIPLGSLTAIVGAPFFVFLLMHGKRGWL